MLNVFLLRGIKMKFIVGVLLLSSVYGVLYPPVSWNNITLGDRVLGSIIIPSYTVIALVVMFLFLSGIHYLFI